MRMYPREFPATRRKKPKRRAERRIYEALAGSDSQGFVYYEWRKGYEHIELDFAVWIVDLGRFALQVKGGHYLLIDGEWYLKTRNGLVPIETSPLDEAWLAALELHDDIEERAATPYNPYVIPVLVFADMEPDPVIERLARRKGVYLVWRTDDLVADLSALARGRRVSDALPIDRICREVCAVTDGLTQLGEAWEQEARAKAARPFTRSPAPSGPELIRVRAREVRFRRGFIVGHGKPRRRSEDTRGNDDFPATGQARNAGGHPPHRVPHPKPVDGPTQVRTNMNMNDPAGVAPAILRLHPGLDQGQLELIGHLEGPTLGIAGPGTGKTLAVALRGTNILLRGLAKPEDLVLCTYSRPAARELQQRFIALATAAGCPGDLSRVRIGTIHGLCRRMLRSHDRRGGPRPGFAVLNEDEQWRLLSRRFDDVFGPDLDVLEREGWRWREPHLVIRHGRNFFERLCDELIDPGELIDSGDPFHAALGRCYGRYRDLLLDEGSADFDHLQRWAAELLEDDRTTALISAGIRYLICDEYQDTSYAQEHILLSLCRGHGNICVVGDDDQSIYRFRGASVRNLLEFPEHFSSCHTVELSVNHRSHPAIVDFYGRWMATAADWSNPDPQGRPFRYPKSITPHAGDLYPDYPAAIRVEGCNVEEEGAQLAELLRFLKQEQVIVEYGQAALLLHSVRGRAASGYLDALERAGIPVNRRPSGSEAQRVADKPRALTVTTVHQAKGREWDVVIVASLDYCNPDGDPVGRELQHYCLRPSFEPADRTSDFDHARQHYVAFSRPRGLLVLTSGDPVHPRLAEAWSRLPRWDSMNRGALARQRFKPAEQPGKTERSSRQVHATPSLRRLDVWVGRAASMANGPRLEMPGERRS